MNNLSILIISLALLTGCATKPTAPEVVQVPLATKCEPTVKVKEIDEYPFDRATKEMSLYEKFQLAVAELNLVKGQNTELKAVVKECTK